MAIEKIKVGSTEHELIASGLTSTSAEKVKLDNTNIAYGTCTTAAATAAKVVTVSGNTNWVLKAGSTVSVFFSNTNSASNPTLNVNGTGAKNIFYGSSQITTSSLGYAGTANRLMTFVYDGTQYRFLSWGYDSNTTYTNVKLGHGYATCSTAEATVAKAATLSSYTLTTGGIVAVKFTNAVPASATLNINSKGAKSIYYRGAAITANVIKAGDVATFIYSGQYHLLSIDRWQQDIDSKQATITGGASTITSSNLTASRALVSDANGKVAVSAVTSTELGYLDGVTSAIQTQLNGKLSTSGTAAKATKDGSGNTITSTYETKTAASSKLTEAKSYTDTQISGHTHGWDDLEDKPFYDTKNSLYYSYSGNYLEKEHVVHGTAVFVKVSEDAPQPTDLVGATVTVLNPNNTVTTNEIGQNDITWDSSNTIYTWALAGILCCTADSAVWNGTTFTKGLYFQDSLTNGSQGSCVTKLYKELDTGFIKQIDGRFIPSDSAANWDKLINRPFGDNEPIDLVSAKSFDFMLDSDFGLYFANIYNADGTPSEQFKLVEGQTYYVEWDSVLYECTAMSIVFMGMDAVGIGNQAALGVGDNSGEPFAIGYVPSANLNSIISIDTASSHTIRVYEKGLKQLEEKYIKFDTMSNPNLLANGDFQVWQRGTTFESASGVYFADRWWTCSDYVVDITKTNDGYQCVSTSDRFAFSQRLIGLLPGEYVLQVSVDGVVHTIMLGSVGGAWDSYRLSDKGDYVKASFYSRNNGAQTALYIRIDRPSATINWVKLEQGTTATRFTSKSYIDELMVCRQFYISYNAVGVLYYDHTNNNYQTLVPIEVMRTTPSIRYASGYGVNTSSIGISSTAYEIKQVQDYKATILFKFNEQLATSLSSISVALELDAEMH